MEPASADMLPNWLGFKMRVPWFQGGCAGISKEQIAKTAGVQA